VANSNNHQKIPGNCSAPSLLGAIRSVFSKIPDHRTGITKFTLADALMSGLAVFGLKYPSLLNFDEDQDDPIIRHNLKTLYSILKFSQLDGMSENGRFCVKRRCRHFYRPAAVHRSLCGSAGRGGEGAFARQEVEPGAAGLAEVLPDRRPAD